ncbi:MAG: hypothetical protein A2Z93_05165 [Curvibacter sp. GWA2_64_110]|nr:MAG: hypothetical protein A2Z93_05165 [Curvibacter sp. GWA2_64_110]HCY15702.1 hypothetical protein [Curvibacter sp.]
MKTHEITNEKLAQAREWFIRRGISLKSWADQHNVNRNVLYQVLEGKSLCTRGESHRIAVLLGLKMEATSDLAHALDPSFATELAVNGKKDFCPCGAQIAANEAT